MKGNLRFFFDRLFRRERLDREMDEEIRSHIELRAAELRKAGLSPEEAQRRARVEFGGAEKYKEQCRETRRFHLLHDFVADLRYGMRMLRKAPGFTVVAVITLALGIGANTAIFSAIYAVLLRPLPYPDPDRIVFVRGHALTTANIADWAQGTSRYEQIAAVSVGAMKLTGVAEAAALQSLLVSDNLFSLLGVRPALGRGFIPTDFRSDSPKVVIVSDRLWRQQMGGVPEAVGSTLVLDGTPYTVIGVLPSDPGPLPWAGLDVWVPLTPVRPRYANAIGRLKPGVDLRAAQTEAETIVRRLVRKPLRAADDSARVAVTRLSDYLVDDSRLVLLVLAGAVGFILLIACANIANLLLARTAARQREIAVRAALGARRGRIVRQLFTETLLLSALGAGLGIIVANWGIRFFLIMLPYRIPRIEQSHLGGGVLAFTLLISVITAVLCAVAPAATVSKVDAVRDLKEGARTGGQGRAHRQVRRALVISEVALALVMLIGAGLLIKTFLLLRPTHPGFASAHKLTMHVNFSRIGVAPAERGPRERAFLREVITRLRALPGVKEVATTSALPFSEVVSVPEGVWIDGTQVALRGRGGWIYYALNTPNYFRVMQMPIVRGRDFTEADNEHAPKVAIINESMGRRFWSDANPVGRRITVDDGSGVKQELTIVGVVRDFRTNNQHTRSATEIFVPVWQADPLGSDLVIETAGDPLNQAGNVRAVIRSVDHDALITRVQSLDELLAQSVGNPRFHATLLGVLAALGLLLATVGIYGVIAYSVEQRTHEIGVRVALGASLRHVLAMVMGEALALALIGIAVGTMGSLALTRLMRDLLFGVSPTDFATFSEVIVLLMIVALLAAYMPARRAARLDPMVALRCE